ncbi:hypothetical protein HN011_007867 [Eciton burchellii]|nr:hypothetical protein HN011_007867 [Eciton burchellii]
MNGKNIKQHSRNENKPEKDSVPVQFVSRDPKYVMPDYDANVNYSITPAKLNQIVNNFMKDSIQTEVQFDFLIRSQFLRTSLKKHIAQIDIPTERIVIEYIEKYIPPKADDCLTQDDWISTIATCGKWILTGSYDNTVQVWDLQGNHHFKLIADVNPIKGVDWISLDEKEAVFASASMGDDCKIWNWNIAKNSANCVNICKGHTQHIETLRVSHDKTLMATAAWDKTIRIWTTCTQDENEGPESKKRKSCFNEPKLKSAKKIMKGHKAAIYGIVWSDKTEIMSCSMDMTIKIWDTEFGGYKQEILGQQSFFDLDYSPLSRTVITGSFDHRIRLYDPRSTGGAIMKAKFCHKVGSLVPTVRWSTTNEYIFISGSHDNSIKMWDTRSLKASLFDILGHTDKVLCCDWSNPKWILSGGADNTLRIFKSHIKASISNATD